MVRKLTSRLIKGCFSRGAYSQHSSAVVSNGLAKVSCVWRGALVPHTLPNGMNELEAGPARVRVCEVCLSV